MIGRLRGEIVGLEGSVVTLEVGGVGYEVQVPDSVLMVVGTVGAAAILHTRQIVREDSVTLYGFADPAERRLFDLLLTVNGLGPRIGMALLGQVGRDGVSGAIQSQDARALTRATGVGAKLAERIILELKDKIQEESLRNRAAGPSRIPERPDELVDALLQLGYKRSEAISAADEARIQASEVPEQIRLALRILRK